MCNDCAKEKCLWRTTGEGIDPPIMECRDYERRSATNADVVLNKALKVEASRYGYRCCICELVYPTEAIIVSTNGFICQECLERLKGLIYGVKNEQADSPWS